MNNWVKNAEEIAFSGLKRMVIEVGGIDVTRMPRVLRRLQIHLTRRDKTRKVIWQGELTETEAQDSWIVPADHELYAVKRKSTAKVFCCKCDGTSQKQGEKLTGTKESYRINTMTTIRDHGKQKCAEDRPQPWHFRG